MLMWQWLLCTHILKLLPWQIVCANRIKESGHASASSWLVVQWPNFKCLNFPISSWELAASDDPSAAAVWGTIWVTLFQFRRGPTRTSIVLNLVPYVDGCNKTRFRKTTLFKKPMGLNRHDFHSPPPPTLAKCLGMAARVWSRWPPMSCPARIEFVFQNRLAAAHSLGFRQRLTPPCKHRRIT